MCVQQLVLFLAVAVVAYGVVIKTRPCFGSDDSTGICTITEARLDPCDDPNLCKLKKKSNTSISFDFVPNFSSSDLSTMVYWESGVSDIDFRNFGSPNACDYTKCPTVAGESQPFEYHLYISKFTPSSTYNLKWKIWNPQKANERCCFAFKIKI